jgi:hypothetical protein
MRVVRCLAAGLVLAAVVGVAQSADLVSLNWGTFTLESDSPSKPKSYDVKTGAEGMSLAMTFDTLTAKADGAVKDASASMSGHFLVQQPQSVALSELRIELKGQIVKTKGSTARIDVTIGNEQKSVEWGENEEVAESFVRTITATVPGGQLPNPFTVSAAASAKKLADHGAAVITLESLSVDAGSSKLAQRALHAIEK